MTNTHQPQYTQHDVCSTTRIALSSQDHFLDVKLFCFRSHVFFLTNMTVAILHAANTEANALDIYTKVCMSGEVEEGYILCLEQRKRR